MRKELTIKDCKCHFNFWLKLFGIYKWETCKFHKECIGDPCASGINVCNNMKHWGKD
jgi:hypothetical protein